MSRKWLKFTRGSVPVVDVRLGSRRYRALVDTGSSYTMIMPDLALKLGLSRVGTKMIVALNGQYETLVTVNLPPVGFGNTELPLHEAGLRNLRPLGLGVELLLGIEAFQKLRLQIDFKEGHIYLLDWLHYRFVNLRITAALNCSSSPTRKIFAATPNTITPTPTENITFTMRAISF